MPGFDLEFPRSIAHEHEQLTLGYPSLEIFLFARFKLVSLQMLDVLAVYDSLLLAFLFAFKCIHDDCLQLTD